MAKRCPHCNKIAKFESYVIPTCTQYLTSNHAVTKCCGNIVLVVPDVVFDLYIPETKIECDSWGCIAGDHNIENDR